jgi:hypothetical protein
VNTKISHLKREMCLFVVIKIFVDFLCSCIYLLFRAAPFKVVPLKVHSSDFSSFTTAGQQVLCFELYKFGLQFFLIVIMS